MDKKTTDHILNVLRRGTVKWSGRSECLKLVRRRFVVGEFKNGKPKSIWKYRCKKCEEWFRYKEMEVDHIVEVGPFKGDFDDYARRMYCDQSNLQALCKWCHQKKTAAFNASTRYKRKNKDSDIL